MNNAKSTPTIDEVNVAVALGQMFILHVSSERQYVYDIDPVHDKMRPLVEAIDETGLVKVINSCPGHFDNDVAFHDQAHAGALIGFLVCRGVDHASIDCGFGNFPNYFDAEDSPVYMKFFKQIYTPEQYRYYKELIPADNDMLAFEKRSVVDVAIEHLTQFVKEWSSSLGGLNNPGENGPK